MTLLSVWFIKPFLRSFQSVPHLCHSGLGWDLAVDRRVLHFSKLFICFVVSLCAQTTQGWGAQDFCEFIQRIRGSFSTLLFSLGFLSHFLPLRSLFIGFSGQKIEFYLRVFVIHAATAMQVCNWDTLSGQRYQKKKIFPTLFGLWDPFLLISLARKMDFTSEF